jgi:hypothetical protein
MDFFLSKLTWEPLRERCEHNPAHCGVHNPCRPHLLHATPAHPALHVGWCMRGMQKVGPAGVVHPTVHRVMLTHVPGVRITYSQSRRESATC